MPAEISKNVTTLHHGLDQNEHKNIISVFKIAFLSADNSVVMFPKVI